MSDQEKINAVLRYLQSQFRDCKIRSGRGIHGFNLDAEVFGITCGDSIYTAGISDELIGDEDFDVSDINNLLQKFRLAEKLREFANSKTCMIVTSESLRLVDQ